MQRWCTAGLLLGVWLALGCGGDDRLATSAEPQAGEAVRGEGPLNVVLISLDTTRADAMSLYGNERTTTPEIDRLAERGAVFEAAYASQPSTLPSHSTMMTGRLPFAHGARANAGYLLAYDNETLAEVFERHGYVTAAEIAAPVIGRRTQINQGFQQFRDLESFDVRRKTIRVQHGDEYQREELPERDAADITRYGLEFLRRNADSPFFLWLHYFDPHAFYVPPEPWNQRFKDMPYYAELHFTDYHVGRVFEEIRKLGLVERTLVVIVADHGEGLGEHDELTHSFYVYDSTMHVPLIFVLPETIAARQRIAQPVRTADIAPTVLELAGLPPMEAVQGVSLAPLLTGDAAAPRADVYGESFEALAMFGSNVLRFLRRDQWKYIHKSKPQLFDLSRDPGELHDLADAHPELVAQLRRDLTDWVLRERIEHDEDRARLDDATLAQLQALGYMGEGAPSGFDEASDLAALHPPDPVDRLGDMERYALGFGALKAKLMDEALPHFEYLVERNPDSLPFVRGLISALEDDALLERGPELLERAKALAPDNPKYFIRAAEVHGDLGDLERAERELEQALVIDPCHAAARVVYAEMLREWGRIGDQIALLEQGIEQCDDDINFRNDLAYILATAADPEHRDGPRALALARKVVAESELERPDYLDTLACAWAESGNFRKAVRHATRALELIQSREVEDDILAEYRSHLESFERAEPIRNEAS